MVWSKTFQHIEIQGHKKRAGVKCPLCNKPMRNCDDGWECECMKEVCE